MDGMQNFLSIMNNQVFGGQCNKRSWHESNDDNLEISHSNDFNNSFNNNSHSNNDNNRRINNNNKRMKTSYFSVVNEFDCENDHSSSTVGLLDTIHQALDLDTLDEMLDDHARRNNGVSCDDFGSEHLFAVEQQSPITNIMLNTDFSRVESSTPPPLAKKVSIGSCGSSFPSEEVKPSQFFPICLPITESTKEIETKVTNKNENELFDETHKTFSLATDEDTNWLSDFLCFVRSDMVEVFEAHSGDVVARSANKKICLGQVGIRCRFCVNLPKRERARRSSTFPSSTGKIYQSFIMMLRDHFVKCCAIPDDVRTKFQKLKDSASQGAVDSKKYWASSARKIGMTDTEAQGIQMNTRPRSVTPMNHAENDVPPHDNETNTTSRIMQVIAQQPTNMYYPPLVRPIDMFSTSEYLFLLMNQTSRAFLTKEEKVGNRRTMEEGLPGFGCKYCISADRKGLCRFFPARRRTLPMKLQDLQEHLLKCHLCPDDVKIRLSSLVKHEGVASTPEPTLQKIYLDTMWSRLRPKVDRNAMNYI